MRGKETPSLYVEGQEVQVNTSSLFKPEWVSAKVTNVNPETRSLLARGFEKFLRLKPIVVEIDGDAEVWAGAKFKAYIGGSRVRPKSVRQE